MAKNKVRVKKNQQKQQKNKGNKKQKQAAPKVSTVQPNAGLYNPREALGEKAFKQAVRQATRFAVRPALAQANRTIGELQKRQNYDVQKQTQLGLQANQNIGSYYQQLAAQEAAQQKSREATGAAYTGAVAQSGKETLAGIEAAGNAAQGGIGTYEGQPIAARERLAAMIAEQGSQASRENNALNAQAQGQQKASMDLFSQMGAATQARGGEQLADANRQVANAVSEIRNQYGESLGKAMSAKLELIEKRPEIAAQILQEMRKGERDYILGQSALHIKKETSVAEREGKSGSIAYARVNARKNLQLTREKHKLRMEELDRLEASESQKAEEDHRFREKELGLVNQMSGKGGGTKEGWVSRPKAVSLVRRATPTPKQMAYGEGKFSGKQIRKRVFDDLVAQGVAPKLAKSVIKQYVRRYKTRGSKDPSPGKDLVGGKHQSGH